jgi:hypothetical protein
MSPANLLFTGFARNFELAILNDTTVIEVFVVLVAEAVVEVVWLWWIRKWLWWYY